MIFAHLPAGYLMVKALTAFRPAPPLKFWLCGLVASVLPDLDILLFHLVGNVPNHRYYPTHWPLFWLGLFVVAAAVLWALGQRRAVAYPAIVLAGVMLHLALDAIAGQIFYLAPFSFEAPLRLVRIPRFSDWWFINYLRHWLFQLEPAICGAAALVFAFSLPKPHRSPAGPRD
ncbi:MAG: metal-dependent hydrolase [Candidatus Adiutrix sp.]|nr:metal-dependent hydrolase [Candidatus Adiutrix sp.]